MMTQQNCVEWKRTDWCWVHNNLSTIAMIYCASLLLIPSAVLYHGDDDGHVDRPYDFPLFSNLVLRISLCKYLLYIFIHVQIVSFLSLIRITDFYNVLNETGRSHAFQYIQNVSECKTPGGYHT